MTVPFRSSKFGGNARVSARSTGKPAAVYPAAIATDSDMILAVDRQQTTLALPLNSTDTSMTVMDPSMIVAYNLLSIDNEIVKTTGPPAGNVVPIARGFDGTAPALHLASATVSGFIDAYHHNRLIAEVEAIEQTLGVNLSRIPAFPFIYSPNYDFPAQTPGGALTVGNNLITISPVPFGVNGSDQNHYLYISGGTGTPEAVLITGGSAVSGGASGTLIVNCAGAHSGAWTIKSATAGIQESVNLLASTGGKIYLPYRTMLTYATITVSGLNSIWLVGQGISSWIQPQFTTGDVIYFNGTGAGGGTGWGNALVDLQMGSAVQTITTANSLVNVHLNGQTNFHLNRCDIHDAQICLELDAGNACTDIFISENQIGGINPSNGVGIWQRAGADIYITNNVITGWTTVASTAGVQINQGSGTKLIGNDIFAAGTCLLMNPGNGQEVLAVESIDNWYDSGAFPATNWGDGMYFGPTGTGIVKQFRSSNDWFQGNGVGIRLSGGGTGAIDGAVFTSPLILFNKNEGILYLNQYGKNIQIIGAMVAGNGEQTTAVYNGLTILAGCGNIQVRGGQFGQSNGMNNTQSIGIYIAPGTSDYISIIGADVRGNINAGLSNGATGTHNIIKDVTGYNPVGQSAITVGASPFTYTAGACPETIYISGGTVTRVQVGPTQVATVSNLSVPLPPNGTVTVTYSAAPTMVKDVQ